MLIALLTILADYTLLQMVGQGETGMMVFLGRYPCLTLRKEEALSYMRARSAQDKVVEEFFAKLAAVLARLNLLSKPMLIYNADETGFSKVHKPQCKVLARRGQRTVWGVISGERGRTHTLSVWVNVWSCSSTSNDLSKGSHA